MPRIQDLVKYFTPIQAKLICDLNGGWMDGNPNETSLPLYASATTTTITGYDATLYYAVGDKVRLKQGGNYKYFYITAVAAALLTLFAGTDYTLTNAAITDFAVSKSPNPIGFPNNFNWAPTLGVTSGTISGSAVSGAKFCMNGTECFHDIFFQLTPSATPIGVTYTLPLASQSARFVFPAWIFDGVTDLEGVGRSSGGSLTVVNLQLYNNAALSAAVQADFHSAGSFIF